MKNNNYVPLFLKEIQLYRDARKRGDHGACFVHLGRAHVISQLKWSYHMYVHALMFNYAWERKDLKELRGQLVRLIVTIPGHLLKKLPKGNIGWATIGLTENRPIPEDLKKFFE